MARVGKHDDPEGDGERLEIKSEGDLGEPPLPDAGEAISNHDDVDEDVGDGAIK